MGFWTKDLFRGEEDKRKSFSFRDWALMAFFTVLTWILASLFAHFVGVSWVVSQFVSLAVTVVTVFLLVGTWMYPTLAEVPLSVQGSQFLIFLLLGSFFFGFELHSGHKNLYQILFDGFRPTGQWYTVGLRIGELGFIAAYAKALTIVRYLLFQRLDHKGEIGPGL